MKIPKLKPWQRIEIGWDDSIHQSGWYPSRDINLQQFDKEVRHQTVGYFYGRSELGILVVQSRGIEVEGSCSVDAQMFIPISAIRTIKVV
jgi:hypothetical protein